MRRTEDKRAVCLMSIWLLGICALTGCGQLAQSNATQQVKEIETGFVAMAPGIYDSEDTAIVVKKDTEESSIQLQNMATGKRYTLSYDGTTAVKDKYDQEISLSQVEQGSIVQVRFFKEKKKLSYVKLKADAFSFSNLENYVLDAQDGTLTIGKTSYNLSNHVVMISQDKEIELMDIHQTDRLSVWGYHNQIYGINVERGHGYLRLKNDSYFVGGWIEVGQSVIRKITEDMLIVVPEGKTAVKVSHNGSSATQEITFTRNEEMAWDLGEVEITTVQKGRIVFTLNPATAEVTVDGTKIDTSKPVELEYGLHQMTVTAEGYDTVAQYIKVGEASANVAVDMEKSEEASEEAAKESASETVEEALASDTSADNTTKTETPEKEQETTKTENTTESSTTPEKPQTSHKVHIDSPEGVEVYLDGNYIGIAPIEFEKTAGSYVITLRKTGYQTRSYTLQIDSEEKDVNYSFSELSKLEIE